MRYRLALIVFAVSNMLVIAVSLAESQDPFASVSRSYTNDTHSLLKKFCFDCHNSDEKQGELDLQRFHNLADIRKEPRIWESILAMLRTQQMPPEDSEQLSDANLKRLIDWINAYLDAEARANAGDPGRVVLRRLNNVEFDNTVRDLIGVDLSPSSEFPVDSAAGEGFVNTGDSLNMSPGLLQKYMKAAREIAGHAVMLPNGIEFAETPHRRDWVQERFRDIEEIYALYADKQGLLPLKQYLEATLRYRELSQQQNTDLDGFARQRKLNPNHFRRMWQELNRNDSDAE